MNLAILKCELARLAALYAMRLMWGFDCKVDELENKINEIYNKILLVETISRCKIPNKLYKEIEIDVNRLIKNSPAGFCTNC
jgi:hypothetical protein